jgi:hypothetical protein
MSRYNDKLATECMRNFLRQYTVPLPAVADASAAGQDAVDEAAGGKQTKAGKRGKDDSRCACSKKAQAACVHK